MSARKSWGRSVAGMIRMAEEGGAASHWRVYFQTEDCGASVGKARRLGAQCILPPTPIPGVALLTDPQGGLFALLQSLAGHA